ncbi:MAG: UDP-N-acetylglucosamine diphosphorylase/glucosamine-1-phosphate N-acetyltransferase [Gammaproteobacteria bacterium RBG_16_57_12]|nr:MAG: UDP-N-acetylglucosamine diphosphorylase/glucosamine-1-phosphate N-acetyltransferase [Gammaproteobacteria bacterium RBG_16_57_12]
MTPLLSIIILAAGQGTRMKSDLPKVLHELGDRSLLEHVHDVARELGPRIIQVVYGHGGEQVRERLTHLRVQWVEQAQQRGTGHAVEMAMPRVPDDDIVLVLYGDVPLVRRETLSRLVQAAEQSGFGLLTATLTDPTGYGRIVRDARGKVARIVEHKDANTAERAIAEINTGMMAIPARRLRAWLSRLENNNSQGEFYLTDVVGMAVGEGVEVQTVAPASLEEIMGVNNKQQLAELERAYQRLQAQQLMTQGVTLRDPARCDVRGKVTVGRDVCIDINVLLSGEVRLGNRVNIGPNCVLRDVVVGDDVTILANSVIEQSVIGNHCAIGPFARIRPETQLADGARIGNFVEIKKAQVGPGSKINHLSYVGDTTVGANVNIGAGTITCNYDGANKHQTIIGDDAFIGSGTQLVAPVEVGAGATIGAGSTICRDAPAGELTLSRSPQKTVTGWKRPQKKSKH